MTQDQGDGGEAMQLGGIGLTPEEEQKVRAAAASPDDEEALVEWANDTSIRATMLELVLAGQVKARINDDGEVAVSLSEAGVKYVEEQLLAKGRGVAVEVEPR